MSMAVVCIDSQHVLSRSALLVLHCQLTGHKAPAYDSIVDLEEHIRVAASKRGYSLRTVVPPLLESRKRGDGVLRRIKPSGHGPDVMVVSHVLSAQHQLGMVASRRKGLLRFEAVTVELLLTLLSFVVIRASLVHNFSSSSLTLVTGILSTKKMAGNVLEKALQGSLLRHRVPKDEELHHAPVAARGRVMTTQVVNNEEIRDFAPCPSEHRSIFSVPRPTSASETTAEATASWLTWYYGVCTMRC